MNELLSHLERASDVGCTEIRKNALLLWYGRDRMTKSLWADLHEKWQEVEDESSLLVGDAAGTWVLVYGNGLTVGATAWLRDVRELAGIGIPLAEAVQA